MDGVGAVRQLLVNDAALIALVPASRIVTGPHPLNATLPMISLQSVSTVDRNVFSPGGDRFVVERVQATVQAANYPSQKQIIRAVRDAGDYRFPSVAGITNVTVQLRGKGPDMMSEEAAIYIEAQDFEVTYSEERTNG